MFGEAGGVTDAMAQAAAPFLCLVFSGVALLGVVAFCVLVVRWYVRQAKQARRNYVRLMVATDRAVERDRRRRSRGRP